MFLQEFKTATPAEALAPLEWTEPFVPESIYSALAQDKRFDVMQQGRQEDAQEFLGFFLEALHDELVLAIEKQDQVAKPNGAASQASAADDGEDGWLEVGSKGRTATTLTVSCCESLTCQPD